MTGLTRRAVLASGLSTALLSTLGTRAIAQGGTAVLKMAGTKAKTRLDPHIDVAWEVLMILSAMYDTLVYQDASGEIVPGLAQSWTIADDGMSYDFVLREGVTFHDGTPFDAEAVKFNIERIQALGPKSQKAASLISDVAGVEVISPTEVRMIMAQPNGGLLFNLSLTYTAMVSPKAAAEFGDEYHMHQSGTGPYMMTEYEVSDHYLLTKNPDYAWAPSIYDGTGAVDAIEWRFLPEAASRSVSLMAGDFDVVFDLLPTSLSRVERSKDYEVLITHLSGQPTYWFLNTELAPTDDPAVASGFDLFDGQQGRSADLQREPGGAKKAPDRDRNRGDDQEQEGRAGGEDEKADQQPDAGQELLEATHRRITLRGSVPATPAHHPLGGPGRCRPGT